MRKKCFDSKLVRLKVGNGNGWLVLSDSFRFQIGAIKSG